MVVKLKVLPTLLLLSVPLVSGCKSNQQVASYFYQIPEVSETVALYADGTYKQTQSFFLQNTSNLNNLIPDTDSHFRYRVKLARKGNWKLLDANFKELSLYKAGTLPSNNMNIKLEHIYALGHTWENNTNDSGVRIMKVTDFYWKRK